MDKKMKAYLFKKSLLESMKESTKLFKELGEAVKGLTGELMYLNTLLTKIKNEGKI